MLKLLTVALIILLLNFPVTAAIDVSIETPKANIIIDGVRDKGYGEFVDIGVVVGNGATGKICTAWDDDYIYYYIEVYDTTPFHNDLEIYERDCVELYFDWFNNKGTTFENDGYPYWQLRIASSPGFDGFFHTNMINGEVNVPEYITVLSTTTVVKPIYGIDLTSGYIIEVGIPISLIEGGIYLFEGMPVSVDFLICDNQFGEGCSSIAFLTRYDIDTQWENPSGCHGILLLQPEKIIIEEEIEFALLSVDIPLSTINSPQTHGLSVFIVILLFGICIIILRKKEFKQ